MLHFQLASYGLLNVHYAKTFLVTPPLYKVQLLLKQNHQMSEQIIVVSLY